MRPLHACTPRQRGTAPPAAHPPPTPTPPSHRTAGSCPLPLVGSLIGALAAFIDRELVHGGGVLRSSIASQLLRAGSSTAAERHLAISFVDLAADLLLRGFYTVPHDLAVDTSAKRAKRPRPEPATVHAPWLRSLLQPDERGQPSTAPHSRARLH